MLKACNDFVILKRDEAEAEKAGFILPKVGQVKPHQGTVLGVGKLAKDPDIKTCVGKKVLFHPTVGFSITHEDEDLWILKEHEIIGIL